MSEAGVYAGVNGAVQAQAGVYGGVDGAVRLFGDSGGIMFDWLKIIKTDVSSGSSSSFPCPSEANFAVFTVIPDDNSGTTIHYSCHVGSPLKVLPDKVFVCDVEEIYPTEGYFEVTYSKDHVSLSKLYGSIYTRVNILIVVGRRREG